MAMLRNEADAVRSVCPPQVSFLHRPDDFSIPAVEQFEKLAKLRDGEVIQNPTVSLGQVVLYLSNVPRTWAASAA
jgi:hypothetical protein